MVVKDRRNATQFQETTRWQKAETPPAAARAQLAQAMADIDAVLPGSLVIRHTRCGKRRCACRADPPALHGPYIQWTRT